MATPLSAWEPYATRRIVKSPVNKVGRFFLLAIGLAATPWLLTHPADAAGAGGPAFEWQPQAAPRGPMVIVVSLAEQSVHVYRNGIAIGSSPISSGRSGHATPTGVFTILQKEREHRSNLYDDAPMPYMERLTWDGVALHAGTLPGYAASHGCVRLPHGFAQRLFEVTARGDTVVVADAGASAPEIVHPAVLAPVTPLGEAAMAAQGSAQPSWWDDAAGADGPVSILASLADRRVYALRNGVRIGSADLVIAEGFHRDGAVVFVAGQATPAKEAIAPAARTWAVYPIRGSLGDLSMDALASSLRAPQEFVAHIEAILVPGTSILVTDQPALRSGDASAEPVLQSSTAPDDRLGHGN